MYLCKLLEKNGNYAQEIFYRDGESAEQIQEDLESYQWPMASPGSYWVITHLDDDLL